MEGDQEEEDVIPTCWVKNKSVMWPSGTNVLKAMREMKLPEEHWIKFDLVKIKFTSGLLIFKYNVKLIETYFYKYS